MSHEVPEDVHSVIFTPGAQQCQTPDGTLWITGGEDQELSFTKVNVSLEGNKLNVTRLPDVMALGRKDARIRNMSLYGHAMAAIDNRFILLTGGGGQDDSTRDKYSKGAMCYDNDYEIWKDLGAMNKGRMYHGMSVCDKHIYFVFGGYSAKQDGKQETSIERFDSFDPYYEWEYLQIKLPEGHYDNFVSNIIMTQYKEDYLLIFGGGKNVGTLDSGLKIKFA